MTIIRGTGLLGYPALVRELGKDPDPLLRRAGIDPASVGDHERFIDYRNLIAAMRLAALELDRPDFGRLLAERQGLQILGPVGVAARTSETVADALASIARYLVVYSPAISATLIGSDHPDNAVIEFRILVADRTDHSQTVELALGVIRRILKMLIGPRFAPVTVHITHGPLAPLADYRRYFGAPTRFAETFSGFTIRASDLARRIASESDIHKVVTAYLDSISPVADGDIIEEARRQIRHLLPAGGAELRPVAEQLRMHPRTLQRHLHARELTFAGIIDEVRAELVRSLLTGTNVPLSQVAATVGYSDQAVLTRACRRWFDCTPSQYRRDHRSP